MALTCMPGLDNRIERSTLKFGGDDEPQCFTLSLDEPGDAEVAIESPSIARSLDSKSELGEHEPCMKGLLFESSERVQAHE